MKGGCIYWMVFQYLSDNCFLFLFCWCTKFSYLYMLSHPCIPMKNTTWSQWTIILCIATFNLLLFCWEFWYLCPSEILVCNFCLSCSCLVLESEKCWSHIINFEEFFPFKLSGIVWEDLLLIRWKFDRIQY